MEVIRQTAFIKFVVLCLFIYYIGIYNLSSQTLSTTFEKITIEDGLSHSNINSILQDKIGFMWFATHNGLNRYDGHTIKTYQHDPGDSTSLSHNGIVQLFEDSDGYIWVVNNSFTGMNRYNPETNKFTTFAFDPADSSSLSSNAINHIMQDSKGNIWVCTRNALNLVIQKRVDDKITTHFKRYYYPPDIDDIKWAHEDNNGCLLLFANKLIYFDSETPYFNKTQVDVTNSRILSLAVDKSDNIFLGTLEDGLVKLSYNENSQEYQRAPLDELSACNDKRNVLLIDEKEQFWIGTESKGLYKYNKSENLLVNYKPDDRDPESISDNFINSLATDRSGILWIGTGSQGICKYDLFSKKFYHIKSIPGNVNSLSDNVISGIDGNNPDELWVSTSKGVNRILFEEGGISNFTHYYHNPNDDNTITSDNTFSLVQRKNGDVWVGSTGGSMSRIIPEALGKKNGPVIKRYPVSSWTFTLYEDSEGILWGGTWGGGLWRLNDETKEFTYYRHDPDNPTSICENVIWAIGEDRYKNIWIGGNSQGLSILPASEKDKANPVFINFEFEKENISSLSSNTIHAFYEDRKGTMWIGTSYGINKVIDKANFLHHCQGDNNVRFMSYNSKNGLASDGIIGIVEDEQGNLWLSTSNGISKFDFSDSTFYNYSENDGLLSNEFSHNAFFKNSTGRIFFGGPNGITAFDPSEIKPNPFIPIVVITDFKLFNQSVEIGQKINNDKILTRPIHMTSEIKLNHKNNRFSIEFAALHYAQPEKNQYAYRLEGFEDNWNTVDNQHIANYSNLDAGTYTFRVKGSNNNGIWNEAGSSLTIEIKPPWWNTWLFRILSLIVIIGMLISMHLFRIAQIKKQNIYLENKVKKRTKEIDNKNQLLLVQSEELNNTNTILEERQQQILEQAEELIASNDQLRESNQQLSELNTMKDKIFTIIGHDLKNPINAIMGFSELLKMKIERLTVDKRNQYITNIYESSSKTYQLLESLLNWARSQNQHSKTNPEQVQVNPIIMGSILLLKEQASKKNISIDFETNDEDATVFCDQKMVQTVIRNLLSNAIKFTNPNGQVTISYSTKENPGFCTFHISDTGLGISAYQISNLFTIEKSFSTEGTRGEKGTGLGLVLCRDFIEKNKGKIWVESKLGVGTTFSFTLPQASN